MRAMKAKRLRREVYGKEYSLRERQYEKLRHGQVVNVGRRRQYQSVKRGIVGEV